MQRIKLPCTKRLRRKCPKMRCRAGDRGVQCNEWRPPPWLSCESVKCPIRAARSSRAIQSALGWIPTSWLAEAPGDGREMEECADMALDSRLDRHGCIFQMAGITRWHRSSRQRAERCLCQANPAAPEEVLPHVPFGQAPQGRSRSGTIHLA